MTSRFQLFHEKPRMIETPRNKNTVFQVYNSKGMDMRQAGGISTVLTFPRFYIFY